MKSKYVNEGVRDTATTSVTGAYDTRCDEDGRYTCGHEGTDGVGARDRRKRTRMIATGSFGIHSAKMKYVHVVGREVAIN